MKITDFDSPQKAVVCRHCNSVEYLDYGKEYSKCSACGSDIDGKDEVERIYSVSSDELDDEDSESDLSEVSDLIMSIFEAFKSNNVVVDDIKDSLLKIVKIIYNSNFKDKEPMLKLLVRVLGGSIPFTSLPTVCINLCTYLGVLES